MHPIWANFVQESLRTSLAHVTHPNDWSDKVSMCTRKKTLQGKVTSKEKYGKHVTKCMRCGERRCDQSATNLGNIWCYSPKI